MYGDDPRLSKARVEEMEAWLDAAGVDRRGGTNGAPTARLRCFAGRGIGLEAAVDLERDSTVRLVYIFGAGCFFRKFPAVPTHINIDSTYEAY